ncbi:MAG: hypothetical protein JEZ00_16555 [Anaerolineaceae bacterium]|nr:hypothetical protein [Anaerolineaceae bacterium]
MAAFFSFLEQNEFLIYILFGFVFLIYLQRLIRAIRDWRRALYGLEKETSMRVITTSMVVLMIVGLLIGLEFSLATYIAPAYPDVLALPTPTISFDDATPDAEGLSTLMPGETPEATLVTLNPLVSGGCEVGKLEWLSPDPGSEIRGSVPLIATVQFEDLAFYKYEFSQVGSDGWTTIAAQDSSGQEADLGFWSTGTEIPGDYRLRLVVVNRENQTLPACEIPVTILAEE